MRYVVFYVDGKQVKWETNAPYFMFREIDSTGRILPKTDLGSYEPNGSGTNYKTRRSGARWRAFFVERKYAIRQLGFIVSYTPSRKLTPSDLVVLRLGCPSNPTNRRLEILIHNRRLNESK